MPIPSYNYKGQVIIKYGVCLEQGKYTSKDVDKLDIIDYCNYNDFNELEEIEEVNCELKNNMIKINENLYKYIKDNDIFMSINLDTCNQLVKIIAINNKCNECKNEDYLIPYCFGDNFR